MTDVKVEYSYHNPKLTRFMSPKVIKGVVLENLEFELESPEAIREGRMGPYTLLNLDDGELLLAYISSGSWKHTGALWVIIEVMDGEEDEIDAPYVGVKVENGKIVSAYAYEDREEYLPDDDDRFVERKEIAKALRRTLPRGSAVLAGWYFLNISRNAKDLAIEKAIRLLFKAKKELSDIVDEDILNRIEDIINDLREV